MLLHRCSRFQGELFQFVPSQRFQNAPKLPYVQFSFASARAESISHGGSSTPRSRTFIRIFNSWIQLPHQQCFSKYVSGLRGEASQSRLPPNFAHQRASKSRRQINNGHNDTVTCRQGYHVLHPRCDTTAKSEHPHEEAAIVVRKSYNESLFRNIPPYGIRPSSTIRWPEFVDQLVRTKRDVRWEQEEIGHAEFNVEFRRTLQFLVQNTKPPKRQSMATSTSDYILHGEVSEILPNLSEASHPNISGTPNLAHDGFGERSYPKLTTKDFRRAVYTIVSRNRHHSEGLKRYDRMEWTIDATTEKLRNLFASPEAHKLASINAFARAIKFLLHHGKAPDARALLLKMDWFGITPSVKICNLFLRACSRSQNLTAFRSYLQKLCDQRLRPDTKTWIAFLFLARDNEQREAVFREMRMFSMFQGDKFAISQLAAAIIPLYFGEYLEKGGSAMRFIEILDKMMGKEWFGSHTAKYMIFELGKRGRILEAVETVMTQIGLEREFVPDVDALNRLLFNCANFNQVTEAIWLVQYTYRKWKIVPDRTTFGHLFLLAWNRKMPNLTKVVWRYACMSANTSFKMISKFKNYDTEIWEGGSFAHYHDLMFCKDFTNIGLGVDSFALPTQPYFKRDLQAILRHDLLAHKHISPVVSLQKMLHAALLRDKKWIVDQVAKRKCATWRAVNSINIPIRSRLFMHTLRGRRLHRNRSDRQSTHATTIDSPRNVRRDRYRFAQRRRQKTSVRRRKA